MAFEVADVRNTINLVDESELSDDVVENAISRAETYINELATRSASSEDIIALVKLNYAAYLAYQSYADHVIYSLPVSYNAQGTPSPIDVVLIRTTRDKLNDLKRTADELIDLLVNTVPEGDPGETPEPTDSAEYPDEMKLSNLSSTW